MLRALMYFLFYIHRRRIVYVLTEKRIDGHALCIASWDSEGEALIAAWARAAAAASTRSGTAHYLHCLFAPRRLDPDKAHLWAQARLVQSEPDPGVWTNKDNVVIEAPGVLLMVEAK